LTCPPKTSPDPMLLVSMILRILDRRKVGRSEAPDLLAG
jgi:hypothetical protein